MSTIKVDAINATGGTTGMALASNGIVTIQGEGTATTNLQQGLAKCWCTITQGSTHTLVDSFNVGSIGDNGDGETTVNFTNTMGNSNWCASVTCGNENNRRGTYNANNTTRLKIEVYAVSSNTSAEDSDHVCGSVHGDLA